MSSGGWENVSGIVRGGPSTPEELEALHEDALVMGDSRILVRLYEERAVLVTDSGTTAIGVAECAELALASWQRHHPYVADPLSITQARDLALIVSNDCISVVRRNSQGVWKYAVLRQCAASSE
ncbi:MAG: hypothetical protein ACRDHN_04940 [Thermomicrobiales bacterium]